MWFWSLLLLLGAVVCPPDTATAERLNFLLSEGHFPVILQLFKWCYLKSWINVIPERKKLKTNVGIESEQRCEMQVWGGVH